MSVSAKRLKFTNSLLSWSSIIITIYHRALDPGLVKEQLAASLQSIVYFLQYDERYGSGSVLCAQLVTPSL